MFEDSTFKFWYSPPSAAQNRVKEDLKSKIKGKGRWAKKENRESKDEKIVQVYEDIGCDFEGKKVVPFLENEDDLAEEEVATQWCYQPMPW